MKTQIYILALLSLVATSTACSDDDEPLPSDYTNVGIETGSIDEALLGQWTKYVITETTYAGGKETTRSLGTYTGDFRFDNPYSSPNGFIAHNFPHAGMFEVRRYGERLDFYKRDTNQHINLMLHELSKTSIVLETYQMYHEDHFIVTSYTLTK